MPAADAKVTAHVIAPDGGSALVDMTPVPNDPGTFQVDWTAEKAGVLSGGGDGEGARGRMSLARDVVTFRADGWSGGELSYGAESGVAGEAVVADGWAVLEDG